MSKSALSILDEKIHGSAVADRPERVSFEEFLRKDARVRVGGGNYGAYSFEGREALLEIVRVLDGILDRKLADSIVSIAGGAQFGKTILELNLAAYVTSMRFLDFGLFLPDKDLANGIVDAKFRPDVFDQIAWFADMITVGKAVNKSGKSVNTKSAFMVSNGKRRSLCMAMGLQKIPTTFTFDIAVQEEVDDIPEKTAKYVYGRLTSSALRLMIKIGTQRVQGRGQEQAWKDGSQGVFELGGINPEDKFPGIVRCQLGAAPAPSDPQLTWAGDFRRDEAPDTIVAVHNPTNTYYLADPESGRVLDRFKPALVYRRPERIENHNWSMRISQLSIGAIGLSQIVSQFQRAVMNPEEMTVFRCDVLALPQSTAQALTPQIIQRSQGLDPFDARMSGAGGRGVYAGIDTGDICYFWGRERESAERKRLIYPTTIPAGDLVSRGISLFHQLGVSCLCIDQRPLVSQARTLALTLNGLNETIYWPAVPTSDDAYIQFPNGLVWDGRNKRWIGARCFVVRFDKKSIGAGIEHGFDVFEEGGKTMFVPLIRCNRYETIDRAVKELLTPAESIVEVIEGKGVRELPSMLLPRSAGCKAMEDVEKHLITGSERAKEKDGNMGEYVDQCANHFLLADAYSALAENEAATVRLQAPALPIAYPRATQRARARNDRSVLV